MTTPLPEVSMATNEPTTLSEFLDFYRAVARRKADGLGDAQLLAPLPGHPSPLTIGGIVSHLASVEDYWWQHVVAGREIPEPWRTPWTQGDDDFDFRAAGLGGDQILAQFDASVARAREVQATATDLDALTACEHNHRPNVRWVLVHLIEEYARHAGHLDLLREAADGQSGD